MPELDLGVLVDEGDVAVLVPARGVAAARRRLRDEGREVDVYGLHPGGVETVAVDLGSAEPSVWCFTALVQPSSWRSLLTQRTAPLVARSPLRRHLFRTCLVVGRAP